MDDSGEGSEEQNADRNADSKGFMRFQWKLGLYQEWPERSPLLTVAKTLNALFLCPGTFWEIEFKGDGLIYLVEEISGKHKLQEVKWIWLAAFDKIYCENQDQSVGRKHLNNFQWEHKRNMVKGTAKQGAAAQEMSDI